MTRKCKKELVEKLAIDFSNAEALIVCDYKGTKVKSLEKLRVDARKSDIKVQIIKNKLANLALKMASYQEAELKDTNIYIWSGDEINLSKIVSKFQESNPESFKIKFGYFNKEVVDLNHINTISKLPNKDELIGMLLATWNGPARYFVTALDNLRKQKQGA